MNVYPSSLVWVLRRPCGCICGSLVTCIVANQAESFALCSGWHRNFSLSSFLQSTRPNPCFFVWFLIFFCVFCKIFWENFYIVTWWFYNDFLSKSINNLTSALLSPFLIHKCLYKKIYKLLNGMERKSYLGKLRIQYNRKCSLSCAQFRNRCKCYFKY